MLMNTINAAQRVANPRTIRVEQMASDTMANTRLGITPMCNGSGKFAAIAEKVNTFSNPCRSKSGTRLPMRSTSRAASEFRGIAEMLKKFFNIEDCPLDLFLLLCS
jgi:hypothetical protein